MNLVTLIFITLKNETGGDKSFKVCFESLTAKKRTLAKIPDIYRGDLFLATENGFLCHFGNLSPFFFKICLKFSQTLDFAQLSGLGLILI